MPKGLNRTDLISLDNARARPNVIYGGFVDRTKEMLVTNDSPLDHLARWATEQGHHCDEPHQEEPAEDACAPSSSYPAFTAFMDSEDEFESGSFYQGYEEPENDLTASKDSLVSTKNVPLPTGHITPNLVPLHVAMTRADIRYRCEGFEMI